MNIRERKVRAPVRTNRRQEETKHLFTKRPQGRRETSVRSTFSFGRSILYIFCLLGGFMCIASLNIFNSSGDESDTAIEIKNMIRDFVLNKKSHGDIAISPGVNAGTDDLGREGDKDKIQSLEEKTENDAKFAYNFEKLQCISEEKNCRPDDIGAFLEEEGATIVHSPLQSIPQTRRIPHAMANNDTYIADQRGLPPQNGTATALVEYNPTLLPLYTNMPNGEISSDFDTKLLDWITGRYHEDISDEDADNVKYISIQRSTNLHDCGGNIRRYHETIAEQCLVAISLLDKDLNTIPDAELVVDLDYYLVNKHAANQMKRKSNFGAYNCLLNDVTITVQRSTKDNPKKDQLFLIFSGQSHSNMIPIDLRRTLQLTDSESGWDTKIKNKPLPSIELAEEGALYGRGLQMRFMDSLVRKRRTTVNKISRQQESFLDWRKNYHFIQAADGSPWFEMTPVSPHESRPINFFHDKFEARGDLNYFPNTTTFEVSVKSGVRRRSHEGQTMIDSNPTKFSFKTVSLRFKHLQKPGIKFRGTACCGDMTYEGKAVKVGITHTVTKERSYLHAFYAFLPYPPFDVVALSGYFCLGGLKAYDRGYDKHWMSQRSGHGADMDVKGEAFHCPKVTFPTGITELIHNRENFIISYGVKDCYSRSIIVPKEKVRILLSGVIKENK